MSIIIPTYNHCDHVRSALDSVFAQTFKECEVIVVNDGSPDDTGKVLAPLAASGRIRYIEQANGGQARARNRGLEEAKGKYVAFLDDDDVWPADKLEWQVEALEKDGELAAVGGVAETFSADGTAGKRTEFREHLTFESLFAGNPILSPGQMLIRGETLRKIGGFNTRLWGADDWDLWMRLAREGRILMQDRVALRYRWHEGNASKDLRRMLKNACLAVEENLREVPAGARRALRKEAYRFLTNYVVQLIHRGKSALKAGRIGAALGYFGGCTRLGTAALRDPWICRRAIREFFP